MNRKIRNNIVVFAICTFLVLGAIIAVGFLLMDAELAPDASDAPENQSGASTSQSTDRLEPTQPGEQENIPVLQILASSETQEWVVLETSFGTFKYPYAFSDIIKAKAINDGKVSKLLFSAQIDGKDIPLYTIHYNDTIGVPFGIYRHAENVEAVSVSVVFAEAPSTLSTGGMTTFQAAQESFNDVITSMAENKAFQPLD